MNHLYPVIIAGGSGTRFWPASRKSFPKQFLGFNQSGQSLIQLTAERLSGLCDPAQITVLTGSRYADLVRDHLPAAKTILEPQAKNTAAAIALAVAKIYKQDPQGVLLSLWSDAAIKNTKKFQQIISHVYQETLDSPRLSLIGVVPDSPHTGYGYIEAGEKLSAAAFTVSKFHEKPARNKAKDYLAAKNFYWNPGMFVWEVSCALKAFAKILPQYHQWQQKIIAAENAAEENQLIADFFADVPSESIDEALLEKAEGLILYPVRNLGWSDVGSWDVWSDFFEEDEEQNVIHGNARCIDARGNLVKIPKGKFAGLKAVNNLIVVDTPDALLICDKSNAQGVREIVAYLKENGLEDFI